MTYFALRYVHPENPEMEAIFSGDFPDLDTAKDAVENNPDFALAFSNGIEFVDHQVGAWLKKREGNPILD